MKPGTNNGQCMPSRFRRGGIRNRLGSSDLETTPTRFQPPPRRNRWTRSWSHSYETNPWKPRSLPGGSRDTHKPTKANVKKRRLHLWRFLPISNPPTTARKPYFTEDHRGRNAKRTRVADPAAKKTAKLAGCANMMVRILFRPLRINALYSQTTKRSTHTDLQASCLPVSTRFLKPQNSTSFPLSKAAPAMVTRNPQPGRRCP